MFSPLGNVPWFFFWPHGGNDSVPESRSGWMKWDTVYVQLFVAINLHENRIQKGYETRCPSIFHTYFHIFSLFPNMKHGFSMYFSQCFRHKHKNRFTSHWQRRVHSGARTVGWGWPQADVSSGFHTGCPQSIGFSCLKQVAEFYIFYGLWNVYGRYNELVHGCEWGL